MVLGTAQASNPPPPGEMVSIGCFLVLYVFWTI